MDEERITRKKLNEKKKERSLKKNSPPNMYNVHCRKKAVTENRTGFRLKMSNDCRSKSGVE